MGYDLHPSAISRIETGDRALSADELARAANALNVSADYLLGLTDRPAPHIPPAPSVPLAAVQQISRALRRVVEDAGGEP